MGYVTNFNQWTRDMFCKFLDVYNKPNNDLNVFYDGDITVIVNAKTRRTGVAKRNPSEPPDRIVGIAVAYARYLNMEIPKEIKAVQLDCLPAGTAFRFTATDEHINYIIGKVPTNKNLVCYCRDGDKVYTAFKNISVYVY